MLVQLQEAGIDPCYEQEKMSYTVPESIHTYTPDFPITTRGTGKKIYLEAKGLLTAEDRKKMLNVRASNPDKDIRFVFQRAAAKIYPKSPTTYGDWCDKNGFLWADKGTIPEEWLDE